MTPRAIQAAKKAPNMRRQGTSVQECCLLNTSSSVLLQMSASDSGRGWRTLIRKFFRKILPVRRTKVWQSTSFTIRRYRRCRRVCGSFLTLPITHLEYFYCDKKMATSHLTQNISACLFHGQKNEYFLLKRLRLKQLLKLAIDTKMLIYCLPVCLSGGSWWHSKCIFLRLLVYWYL